MKHPISLDSLIDWLQKQPADDTYCWGDTRGCLGFCWLTAMGIPVERFGDNFWYNEGDEPFEVHKLDFKFSDIACAFPMTYGAALERALALRASQ